MMKIWMIALFCLPLLVQAQDYTREGGQDGKSMSEGARAEMLVLPYHPHYHISEVDRMMCPPTMDVSTLRKKVRSAITREITEAFSDSLEVIDLSLQIYDEAIDIQEYMYNAMDFEYVELKDEEEKKKRFDIGLPKRKDEKIYGAKNHTKNGQLDRKEITHDRFMMASVANTGAVDYMQDRYGFEHLLVITQLEIMRDLDDPQAGGYVCSMHFTLLDAEGVAKDGYKEIMKLNAEQLQYNSFKNEVIPAIAREVLIKFWPNIHTQAPISSDNTDY